MDKLVLCVCVHKYWVAQVSQGGVGFIGNSKCTLIFAWQVRSRIGASQAQQLGPKCPMIQGKPVSFKREETLMDKAMFSQVFVHCYSMARIPPARRSSGKGWRFKLGGGSIQATNPGNLRWELLDVVGYFGLAPPGSGCSGYTWHLSANFNPAKFRA